MCRVRRCSFDDMEQQVTERVLSHGAGASLGWQASPHADPPGGNLTPWLLFSMILYVSFHLGAAKRPCSVFPSAGIESALKTRWVRIKRVFCVIGGCDGSAVGLPLLFDFPFPVPLGVHRGGGSGALCSPHWGAIGRGCDGGTAAVASLVVGTRQSCVLPSPWGEGFG